MCEVAAGSHIEDVWAKDDEENKRASAKERRDADSGDAGSGNEIEGSRE